MAFAYRSLYHSTTWAALSLLMAGVLPSVSSTLPPWHHRIDQNEMLASVQLLLVEEWIGGAGDDQVVAGLRGRLGGALGEQLRAGDRVDAHGDPGLLGEDLRLTPELVVGGRDEVIEGEERQLALLGERRRA